jgi:DNA polymerase
MDKQKALDKIAREIDACKICRKDKIGLPVPGEGNPNAKIVFIGEAPGKTEANTGRPFIGRSGKLLRELIRSAGLDDVKDVYITSPVKYLPKHGTPTPAEIAHGRIHLNRQLDIINPKVIVLLGSTAVQAVLEEKVPVLSRHGKTIEKNGRKYFLTLHPAAAIRFVKFKKLILEDFKKLKKIQNSR